MPDIYILKTFDIQRWTIGNGPLRDRNRTGQGFMPPLWEAYHDLDSASLDRDPDAAFPAFNEDH